MPEEKGIIQDICVKFVHRNKQMSCFGLSAPEHRRQPGDRSVSDIVFCYVRLKMPRNGEEGYVIHKKRISDRSEIG